MSSIVDLPPFLRPKEAMFIARLSRNTLKARVREGKIEAETINTRGDMRIVTESLLDFLGNDKSTRLKAFDILRSL